MTLQMKFGKGRLHGTGEDQIGPFQIQGHYDPDDQVRFTKRYPYHKVRYEGRWDGASIAGTWTINDWGYRDRGEFEIWPLKDDEERAIRHEELESVQTLETPQPVPALD
jgi:hypothetical protein